MKPLLICFLFLSISTETPAQRPGRLDSLKKIQAQTKSETERTDLLILLAKGYKSVNPKEGLIWGNKALALAQKERYVVGEIEAYGVLGGCALESADYITALSYYFKGLRIAEANNNDRLIATFNSHVGVVYYLMGEEGDLDRGLAYLQKSLAIYSRIKSSSATEKQDLEAGMAKVLLNIGSVYLDEDELQLARSYYSRSIALSRLAGDETGVALGLGAEANINMGEKEYSQAISDNLQALHIYRKLGNQQGVARTLGNTGICFLRIAQDSLQRRFGRSDSIPLTKEANLERAVEYLSRAINAGNSIGYLEGVAWFSKMRSEAYEMQGNSEAALDSYKEFSATNDSMAAVSNRNIIAQGETERAVLIEEKQLLAAAKKRNERGFFAAGIALMLVIVAFVVRERKRSEKLLLNILPRKIAARLKRREHPTADQFAAASIMFIDMAQFTQYSAGRDAKAIVSTLNDTFTRLDRLAEEYGLEKIKTIGDCYMAVAGLPEPCADHAIRAAKMALAIRREMQGYTSADGIQIKFRIGIDCGPVVAGVIGRKKFIYDLWGDAVNTAARMESSGVPGEIHCSEGFRNCADNGEFLFRSRGSMEIKGKGVMNTWFILNREEAEKISPGAGTP